jgi:dethiobiotin synthetase
MLSKMHRDPTETTPARNRPRGVFVTGNDTGVGKTFVACELAKCLKTRGLKVGVYKPVASGCEVRKENLISDDAISLWEAAGRPGRLEDVCPQRFAAPLAPNLAARQESKAVATGDLLKGAQTWLDRCDFTIVEGAGGYFSPLSDEWLNADLALELDLPVLLVVENRLGAIHQAMATTHALRSYRGGLCVVGIVLNDRSAQADTARESNLEELRRLLPDLRMIRWRFGSAADLKDLLQCLDLLHPLPEGE